MSFSERKYYLTRYWGKFSRKRKAQLSWENLRIELLWLRIDISEKDLCSLPREFVGRFGDKVVVSEAVDVLK